MEMNEEKKYYRIISELALLALDGSISDEQAQQLNDLIVNHSWAQDYYLEFVATQVALGNVQCFDQQQLENDVPNGFDKELWQSLALNEKIAPAVLVEKIEESEQFPVKVAAGKNLSYRLNKRSLFTLISTAAVWILIVLLVGLLSTEKPVVAKLHDTVNAVWSQQKGYIDIGSQLRAGPMVLSEGFAEIAFNSGVSVLVQAPAEFELESDNRLFLSSGKVFSVVPPEAVGFTIRTTQADIVDYGTEFGVQAEESGFVDTQVFKGKVKVTSTWLKEDNKEECWLTAGRAVSVSTNGQLLQPYAAKSKRSFVQNIEKAKSYYDNLGANLIQNPGFEKDTVPIVENNAEYPMRKNINIQAWQDKTAATICTYYSTIDSMPRIEHDPLPDDCGRNYFVGVEDGEIYQDISVRQWGSLIDEDRVLFELSGWFGGYIDHRDNALLSASFRDVRGAEMSRVSIGEISASERGDKTMFIFKEAAGAVPAGTDYIRIIIKTYQYDGLADSYVDNLELRLIEK